MQWNGIYWEYACEQQSMRGPRIDYASRCWCIGWYDIHHDDVIKWKHFPRYWPFVPGEFLTRRPVTRSFVVVVDLRLNIRLSKQCWGWWFETLSRPLRRHRNDCNRCWYKYHLVTNGQKLSPLCSYIYGVCFEDVQNMVYVSLSIIMYVA